MNQHTTEHEQTLEHKVQPLQSSSKEWKTHNSKREAKTPKSRRNWIRDRRQPRVPNFGRLIRICESQVWRLAVEAEEQVGLYRLDQIRNSIHHWAIPDKTEDYWTQIVSHAWFGGTKVVVQFSPITSTVGIFLRRGRSSWFLLYYGNNPYHANYVHLQSLKAILARQINGNPRPVVISRRTRPVDYGSILNMSQNKENKHHTCKCTKASYIKVHWNVIHRSALKRHAPKSHSGSSTMHQSESAVIRVVYKWANIGNDGGSRVCNRPHESAVIRIFYQCANIGSDGDIVCAIDHMSLLWYMSFINVRISVRMKAFAYALDYLSLL